MYENGQINRSPILILANHKTGTTAIAVLLSRISGVSLANGIRKQMVNPVYEKLRDRRYSFDRFIEENRSDFSKTIIKENLLTFFYNELYNYFDNPTFIYIARDPRDNIRSILNRLNIPGNLDSRLPEYFLNTISPTQKLVIQNEWLGIYSKHYIETLAERWNSSADVFLQNKDNIHLLRYEDFLIDKIAAIKKLAIEANLPIIHDISSLVDIQYQPQGNRNISWPDFFGPENLSIIECICSARMKLLDYNL